MIVDTSAILAIAGEFIGPAALKSVLQQAAELDEQDTAGDAVKEAAT